MNRQYHTYKPMVDLDRTMEMANEFQDSIDYDLNSGLNNVEKIAQIFDGKIWIRHDKIRVYVKVQKGSTAYFEFDEISSDWQSEKLKALYCCNCKVFTNADDRRWAISQSKQIKHQLVKHAYERLDLDASEICDDWRDVVLT